MTTSLTDPQFLTLPDLAKYFRGSISSIWRLRRDNPDFPSRSDLRRKHSCLINPRLTCTSKKPENKTMSTINVKLTPIPLNVSETLVNGKLYAVQLISTLGSTACFLFADGSSFPDVPPRCAHMLTKHKLVQWRVPAGESIWAWVGAGIEASLVITEAEKLL